MPNAPEALLGTVNYEGKSVRVLDLGSALGLGGGQLPQRVRLLIVRQSRTSAHLGIAVQPELEEVASLEGLQVLDLRMLSRIGRPQRS
jgi:chemotaxis signal transduction protein